MHRIARLRTFERESSLSLRLRACTKASSIHSIYKTRGRTPMNYERDTCSVCICPDVLAWGPGKPPQFLGMSLIINTRKTKPERRKFKRKRRSSGYHENNSICAHSNSGCINFTLGESGIRVISFVCGGYRWFIPGFWTESASHGRKKRLIKTRPSME